MAIIASIVKDSIAKELKIRPGDELLTINGQKPEDLIDYQFLTADSDLVLEIQRTSGEIQTYDIEKAEYEDLGLEFTANVFDGIKTCHNKCLFCFVDQLPPNCRPTLNIKDDDYRMSFLAGNYITGSNLKPDDIARIKKLALSPLYISVHSTEPELRGYLMGTAKTAMIMELLSELAAAGIEIHCQIVLCPGINDGAHLAKTISDLQTLWPYVASVAIVPVGLTGFQRNSELRPFTAAEAVALHQTVQTWQQKCFKDWATKFVFLADEFYVLAGLPIPPAEFYEEFVQLENGVGLIALFWQEWQELKAKLPKSVSPKKIAIATGFSGQTALKPIVADLNQVEGLQVELLVAANQFFGGHVTVTGLLTGSCLIKAWQSTDQEYDALLVSDVLLKHQSQLFLDDLAVTDVADQIGKPVIIAENSAQGLFEALFKNLNQ